MSMNKNIKALANLILFIGVMWLFWLADLVNDSLQILPNINSFGIIPRTFIGFIGIFTAPFLHSNIWHLFFNSILLLLLAVFMAFFYYRTYAKSIVIIIAGGGLLVWLFGRNGNHIGSSGVIFGLLGYMIAGGIFRKRFWPFVVTLLILFLFGSTFIFGILPENSRISWESHLWGAGAGILAAWNYRKYNY
jgi:membrane associated rhomboid family serine protease